MIMLVLHQAVPPTFYNKIVPTVATDFIFLFCDSLKLGFYDMRLIHRAGLATPGLDCPAICRLQGCQIGLL